jgi:hypothetical protein
MVRYIKAQQLGSPFQFSLFQTIKAVKGT